MKDTLEKTITSQDGKKMDGMDAGQCSYLLSLSQDIHLSAECCNICAMSEIIMKKKAFD